MLTQKYMWEMNLKHRHHIQSSVTIPHPTPRTPQTMPSTLLYEKACIAADKANALRLQAARLSVPDELYWYNNNTKWEFLSRKEFRSLMIRMEAITAEHYTDACAVSRPNRSTAIKTFWANEWGCEYLPETGQWLDLASNTVFKSETEKKAEKDKAKAAKAAAKAARAQAKAEKKAKKDAAKKAVKEERNQCNDDEEDLYRQILAQTEDKNTHQQVCDSWCDEEAQLEQVRREQEQKEWQKAYDAWYDEEEASYEAAYEEARREQEQKEQKEQKEQEEAQAYLDSLTQGEEEEEEEEEEETADPASRITCQPVFYFEELTDTKGDPDWRAYIYYDMQTCRYVLKGTRRSLRSTGRKTMYPEIKLCFRSSRQLASYLCSSTEELNVTMFAMASDTIYDATFAELHALPSRGGYKTELFGYDKTRPRYSTFLNYLRMLSDVDANHSTFAAF
jgi:hypothetical protein